MCDAGHMHFCPKQSMWMCYLNYAENSVFCGYLQECVNPTLILDFLVS